MADSIYDALLIVSFLTRTRGGATRGEVYILAYLACILSVFDERDALWWRYHFTTTPIGAPYARELDLSLDHLVASGGLAEEESLLSIQEDGVEQLGFLATLGGLEPRNRYLHAACDATLAIPLPVLTESVSNEPQLRSAIQLRAARQLLDSRGIDVLQPHIDGIRKVFGESGRSLEDSDLMSPLVLWLTYLGSERGAA